jgi:hypothetical protein
LNPLGNDTMEIEMYAKRIAAVAALTVAMVAPAVAQPAPRSVSAQNRLQQERVYRHERIYRPAYRYEYLPADRYAYRPAYRYGTGFWPADVAAGIVGGAVGTAGAIAAAPFGAGPYAYYDAPYAYGLYFY